MHQRCSVHPHVRSGDSSHVAVRDQQDKTGGVCGRAADTLEIRLTVTNVSDDTSAHAEIAITSPDLNDALNNATRTAGDLLQRFIRSCNDLTWQCRA